MAASPPSPPKQGVSSLARTKLAPPTILASSSMSATAGFISSPYARVRLTSTSLRSIIEFLPCNVPSIVGSTSSSNSSSSGGGTCGHATGLLEITHGRPMCSPPIMADALFAAAIQAPSTSTSMAAPAGASRAMTVPACVTRPLALIAASPQSRRGLEMYLSGGCVLPPLGSLVLQVQPHRLSSTATTQPSRIGARRASRHRSTFSKPFEISHQPEGAAADEPHALLLVSSTNLPITPLPLLPSRTSLSSSVTRPKSAAMSTLAHVSACRTPPRPVSAVHRGDGDSARAVSCFQKMSSLHNRLSPPRPAVLQSHRISVMSATPPADSTRTSPAAAVQKRRSTHSGSLSVGINAPLVPTAVAEANRNATLAFPARGTLATPSSDFTAAPPLLQPERPTSPSTSVPPVSQPMVIPAALQTLCHALWWVHRSPLPVSLSFLRYREDDIQALWAALSGSLLSAPEERVGVALRAAAAAVDRGTRQSSRPPLHERDATAARACGEARRTSVPKAKDDDDDVHSEIPGVGDSGSKVLAGETRRDIVAVGGGGDRVSVIGASAGGAVGTAPVSSITDIATVSGSPRCVAHGAFATNYPLNKPTCLLRGSRGVGDTDREYDVDNNTLNRSLDSPTNTVLPTLGGSIASSASPILTLRAPVTHIHVHGKAADAALTALLPAHPEVRSLRLTHGTLSDTQLRHLTRVCPDVTHLSLAMNNRIQTTAFLCPPPSDTSSVATSVTTANTTVTARPDTDVGSSTRDHLYPSSSPHQREVKSFAAAARTKVFALSSHSSSSEFAACVASNDATHASLSNLLSREVAAADDTVDALGPHSEAGRGTDASSVQSRFHLLHSRLSPHESSQLDLFSPDEEGELEMRMSLWQAAQTDATERRQLVFILRPQDVVLGNHECTPCDVGGISGVATTGSRGNTAAAACRPTNAQAFLGALPDSPVGLSTQSHLHFSPQTEATATRVVSADLRPVHTTRGVFSGAAPPTSGTSAPASPRSYLDPQHSLPLRLAQATFPELVHSLVQPTESPPSTCVTAAASLSALSTSASHTKTVAYEMTGADALSAAKGSDKTSLFPNTLSPAPCRSSAGDGAVELAPRPGSRPRRFHYPERHRRCKSRGRLPLQPRPTYWADTLVDLDLSYTQVSDEDVARDVPQLRRLHRLSLEGCVRLSQIEWMPLLPHLSELNLSLCSVQGHALYPLGSCRRLVWLKLEGCSSFTAVHQLWCKEVDSTQAGAGGTRSIPTAATADVVAPDLSVVRHTAVGGIPAFTVLPPITGRARTPTPTTAPTAAPPSTAPFTSSVRAATAVLDAGEAGSHDRGRASAVDEASGDGGAEPAPLLSALRVLIATSTGLTDAGLRFLDRVVALDCLMLDRCPGVTDVSVAAMLPSLRTLDVSRTGVAAEGLAGLRLSRTLQQLRLQDCSRLTRLPILFVKPSFLSPGTEGGAVGDETLEQRPMRATAAGESHCRAWEYPLLTILDLSYTKQLTADGLAGLVADEATLAAQAVASAVAEHLAGREGNRNGALTSALGFTSVSPEPLSHDVIFPHMRHVLLRSCDAVAHLDPLRGFTNVVELDLYHTNVTEDALTAALASWTCLEVLDIASTRIRSLAAWCPRDPRSETRATAATTTRQGEDEETAQGHRASHAPQSPVPLHGRLPTFAATLRVLILSNTDVTAEGLAALAFFPQLEVLQMSNCRRIASLRFLELAAGGTSRRSALSELTVTEAVHLTNAETFPYIACCPALRVLSLMGCVQLGSGGVAPTVRGTQHQHILSHIVEDVSVLGRLRGLADLNLSNTALDLLDLRMMLCVSTSPNSPTSSSAQQHHVFQRMWLRGCRHLDEDALVSTAAEALGQTVDPCSGAGGNSLACRPLPLLREVYLSHGKYGAAVLSGLLS